MLCGIGTSFHRGFDFHVNAAGLASAHGVQMKLARSTVAADGRPGTGPADVALSGAEAWQKCLHSTSLAPSVDAANRLHFFWKAKIDSEK